jgi:hypothetical protein
VWNRLHELEKHLSVNAPQPILLPTGNTTPKAALKPLKPNGKTYKRNATFDCMPRPGERFGWGGKEYQIKAVTDDMLTAAVLENGIPKVGRPSEFGFILLTSPKVEETEEESEETEEIDEVEEETNEEEVEEETDEEVEEDADTFQPTDEEREERYANLAWGVDSEDDEFSEVEVDADADADVDIDETYEDD